MFCRGPHTIALTLVWTGLALAQGVPPIPVPAARAKEDAVIAANRRGAKPREVTPSKGLSTLDRDRARIFKSARKAVVYINASTSNVLVDNATGNVFRIPQGTGTGFVWDDLGHVVTNYHVIKMDVPGPEGAQNLENIEVTLSNNKAYKARLIGRSLSNDIAVLHVFAPLGDMHPLPLGSTKDLVVGQSVLAIGNPFGLDHTLTGGIVSALGRVIPSSFSTDIEGVIQTDAAINPGNSGGPLLDMGGRLIGMNTAIPAITGANIGIGFAIPVDTLNKIVPILIAKGQLERPSLGFASLDPLLAARYFGVQKGIVVAEVTPDSPAGRAGLKGLTPQGTDKLPLLGDVIIGFQGKPLEQDIQLADQLELLHPKTPLVFDVLREGKEIKITIRPWEEGKKVEDASI